MSELVWSDGTRMQTLWNTSSQLHFLRLSDESTYVPSLQGQVQGGRSDVCDTLWELPPIPKLVSSCSEIDSYPGMRFWHPFFNEDLSDRQLDPVVCPFPLEYNSDHKDEVPPCQVVCPHGNIYTDEVDSL